MTIAQRFQETLELVQDPGEYGDRPLGEQINIASEQLQEELVHEVLQLAADKLSIFHMNVAHHRLRLWKDSDSLCE